MAIKQKIAYGIIRGLNDVWKSEELRDFTVRIGSTQFGCHRVILASCSGFFRGLFRSGMKENESKCVTIGDLTSETFKLILEAMYTGRGVLTTDNVIEIWKAANLLQIPFIIQECEDFVINCLSLENYGKYFYNGRLLNSKTVTDIVWSFILKNAFAFFKTSYLLDLPFSDVLELVKSQDLNIKSEDEVIKAILRWVEFVPSKSKLSVEFTIQETSENFDNSIENKEETKEFVDDTTGVPKTDVKDNQTLNTVKHEPKVKNEELGKISPLIFRDLIVLDENESRRTHLVPLLSSARICLATHGCLETLLRHTLIKDNVEAKEKVITALLYQLQAGKRNGNWPTGAMHRNISDSENVALAPIQVEGEYRLNVFSFARNTWFRLPSLYSESKINFVAADNVVYAFASSIKINKEEASLQTLLSNRHQAFPTLDAPLINRKPQLKCFEFLNGVWSDKGILVNLQSTNFTVEVVDTCIYVLSPVGKEIWRLDPETKASKRMSDLPNDSSICHVTFYDQIVLVFYSVSTDGVDQTAIHCLDTSLNTWTQMSNFAGPAKGMTSFKDGHATYLLQANGVMWKISKHELDDLEMEYVVKLWSCDWSLHGAVTFNDNLYVYGIQSNAQKDDPQLRRCLPGMFKEIIYMQSSTVEMSSFQPFIIMKNNLLV